MSPRTLPIVLLALAAGGCAVQVASWSGASRGASGASAGAVRPAAAPRGRWEGRSCRWWVLGVPFGLPQIDEAMADALARGGGTTMRNPTVTSEHSFYGLAGQHCYAVKGDVLG